MRPEFFVESAHAEALRKKCDVTNKVPLTSPVPIAISGETSETTPRIHGAVIVRSIQRDSDELDPLQYGILAARGGVLSNVHACSRLSSG